MKGSIEEGKKAVLIVFEKSPLEVNETEIKGIKVLKIYKNGELVFSSSEF